VQRAGEEQEAEHPMQQRTVEVETVNEGSGLVLQAGQESPHYNDSDRGQQGQDHDADGGRQLHEPVVHVAQDGCQHEQGGDQVEQAHGSS
jgi:hypothetical protein